ncbi:DUF3344 domain-containing protein [Streptomyces sp. GXMU-J5]|uniref:DUF3344 domain-containing protein n=1 Tax=Streptomyces beihaiensis TaxID=2984495 RepID=A0ABT3TSF0_9ACTN|nr:DUF3344 domain-containing protein [Streptomyces beihaiensis]MCX3059431.1 DUF3344 domain-containing protein [Streptomyces beihaiensis]
MPGRATATAPATATDAPPAPPKERQRVPFTDRYDAVLHGGVVRAANAAITCRGADSVKNVPCSAARSGARAANGDFDMFYTDVDHDPNTYNSSSAELRVPRGARVTYARLYWGGNLRVGEQKPPRDDGRVLIAEPGGAYKQVLADTVVGHRTARGADAYQASADVTGLVRASGSGAYTVAQINVAMGRSAAGAWGGWTLVAAYEKPSEPLRHVFLTDGFDAVGAGADAQAFHVKAPYPKGAHGYAGLVAYNGDRGTTGDSLTVRGTGGPRVALSDGADPADDVLNSTISGPGSRPFARVPAYENTLGYDSDVFPLDRALARGGRALDFRLAAAGDRAWAGVLFGAVDAEGAAEARS